MHQHLPSSRCLILCLAALPVLLGPSVTPAAEPAAAERFPPLHVPAGFSARLFACDPLIEYPSVIALGPKRNSLFVAFDYVKGLGHPIKRRDEVRLLEDRDGDGRADSAAKFAGGFGSIQGLEFHHGALYVMHAPLLTALEDTDGDGVADERRDVLSGLGLPPEKNPSRLHCANGVVAGYDGWLYLALGDNGCNVPRPEGDRLVLNGGGILRCRPDGTGLHVFSSGLRNIYDVALDDDLNVFVRDNENDGGDYMVRVCFSFFAADHGYPYLYRDHPDEALSPIADLGRGSSAGGVAYRETAFPPEMRGNLFFGEWGRAVVRYDPRPREGGFGGAKGAAVREHDFAFGDAKDPYGFKPTDIVVLRDGSMMVADWADGQSTARGRGRIYHIRPNRAEAPAGQEKGATRLGSASHHQRHSAQLHIEQAGRGQLAPLIQAWKAGRLNAAARRHSVWLFARLEGADSLGRLFGVLKSDEDSGVRLQAVRAIADLTDPVLVKKKLDAGTGDAKAARRLAAAYDGQSPAVRRAIIVALGRLRFHEAPRWLGEKLRRADGPLAHAAMQTMRRSRNWSGVLALLDRPQGDAVRTIALRALAERADVAVVDGLLERLRDERDASRGEYVDLLARVWKKPAPWKYWGYRPAPRPANSVAWERTDQIETALNRFLARGDEAGRRHVLQRMRREKIPVRLSVIQAWLRTTEEAASAAALLEALGDHPPGAVREELARVSASDKYSTGNRQTSVAMFIGGLDNGNAEKLLALARRLEDGPVLAAAVAGFAKRPVPQAASFLMGKLDSRSARVRAASLDALAALRAKEAKRRVPPLLRDEDERVRRAAVQAVAALEIHAVAADVAALAKRSPPPLRRVCLVALRELKSPGAIELALREIKSGVNELEAVRYLAAVGDRRHAEAAAEAGLRTPSLPVVAAAMDALSHWAESPDAANDGSIARLIARIQGRHGLLWQWRVAGPWNEAEADAWLRRLRDKQPPEAALAKAPWRAMRASPSSQLVLRAQNGDKPGAHWLAATTVHLDKRQKVRLRIASRDALKLFINGRPAYQQAASAANLANRPPQVELPAGTSRLTAWLKRGARTGQFSLAWRPLADSAEHERLALLTLNTKGDAVNGRKLFFNAEKSQCVKCHRVGEAGEKIGPDLSGVGSRFSRIHLIESILQPSRSIAPSYRTLSLILADGRSLSGVAVHSDEKTLTLADNQGKKHVIPKDAIEQQAHQPISTMPLGLEKRLTAKEFVDLIAFLASEKRRGNE